MDEMKKLVEDLAQLKKGWTFSDIKEARNVSLAIIAEDAWKLATRAEELLK